MLKYGLDDSKKACISNRYFCIDLETTGIKAKKNQIVEVYYMVMHKVDGKWSKEQEGHRLFYHPLWWLTKNIHDIPKREIKGKPGWGSKDPEVIAFKEDLCSLFDECCNPNSNLVFMAHYSDFERKWLSLNLNKKLFIPELRVYDTCEVEKYINPDLPHNLIQTCARRGILPPNGINFHRAKWDTTGMFEIAKQQFEEIQ